MKTNKTKWFRFLTLFLVSSVGTFTACNNDEDMGGDGQISMQVTDAPIDAEGVTGVYITFTGIEYQKDGGSWEIFEEFEGPVTINLLELQNGKTALLGDFNAGAGNYTGFRFLLDAESQGNTSSTSGCYMTFEDGTEKPLFVPSGDQTGYKAIADFSVPVNGTVEVTADFDLRKSVAKAGATGMYLLKPTIRTIVNNESGEIKGNISNTEEGKNYVVFAYEEGTYTEEEASEPTKEAPRFPNAITSTGAKASGEFVVAFLAPKAHELIFVEFDAEGNPTVVKTKSNIKVESKKSVEVDVAIELGISL
ncbi:MAG: DUF4382 domain-containing protein [Anditalea sp.]